MWRRLTGDALILAGVLLLFSAPAPWLLGNYVMLMVGGAEWHSVRWKGLPTAPHVLHWSDWRAGSGALQHGEAYPPIDPKAEIVAWRVATDQKLFAEYTFYQGKYRYPNGEIKLHPAFGPKPLLDLQQPQVLIWSLSLLCTSVSCFALGWWCYRQQIRWEDEPVAVQDAVGLR